MEGQQAMLTLEERLTALEKNTAESIHELQANTTIMQGVLQGQGQDIKKIFLRLDSVDGRLDKMDGRLDKMDTRLTKVEKTQDEHTAILSEHTAILTDHTARFDRVETLLGQILARLPEQA
jgi:uncharacterized coiled-coil protein SlyX